MDVNYINTYYIVLFLILCLILRLDAILFLLLIAKVSYNVGKENIMELDLDSYETLDEDTLIYSDNDVDNIDIETWDNQFSYLYYRCRFYFDIYGGDKTLDEFDYLSNNYKIFDIKNFINIYSTVDIIEDFNYLLTDKYFFEDFYLKCSKNLINIKKGKKSFDNWDINLLSNQDFRNIQNNKIKIVRMNKFKNILYFNVKNHF